MGFCLWLIALLLDHVYEVLEITSKSVPSHNYKAVQSKCLKMGGARLFSYTRTVKNSFMREFLESMIESFGDGRTLKDLKEKLGPTLEGFILKYGGEESVSRFREEFLPRLDDFIERYWEDTTLNEIKKELGEELAKISSKIRSHLPSE
jgi:hypothetical protein